MDTSLDWLLENLRHRTPGIRHVLVLSRDGLKMCHTRELHVDRADQLAAISAGIQSLSLSASAEFGDGGGAGQAMAEFGGGVLLIVGAGEGAHLAVVTTQEADVGVVGHNMNELVEQIGGFLTAAPRRTARTDWIGEGDRIGMTGETGRGGRTEWAGTGAEQTR
ncbi:putative regulator of Ras-like GTPase activity (Roadblock/LC7/MglB family) [Nocardiopsis arvandica]|uniref:Putative regulator of Ras-like GTPase activity (Roadblock/LC7/MglB family) n=1 Tax=Nocardiopsis sinuspersici TaxID=501010 RepID=A0A7Y9X8E5_9ACTN|nr:putative regulator of Ras-like GTPase activity (Roadblock/LC7/MglB family) [Nocardiopsis sinuspersici]